MEQSPDFAVFLSELAACLPTHAVQPKMQPFQAKINFCSFRHSIAAIATIDRRGKDRMKSHTEYLTFNIPSNMAFQTGIGEGQLP